MPCRIILSIKENVKLLISPKMYESEPPVDVHLSTTSSLDSITFMIMQSFSIETKSCWYKLLTQGVRALRLELKIKIGFNRSGQEVLRCN